MQRPHRRASREDTPFAGSKSNGSVLQEGLASTIAGQQHALATTISGVLAAHRRVALVNFPNHHNAGDPAIWLGTRALLRSLGVRVTYQCDWRTYERHGLARAVSRGTSAILLCGGGNLGDVYPAQTSREAVLRDFPMVPVVQLPQSIWFGQDANGRAFAQLAQDHEAFTLFVRDRASLEWASDSGLEARLCPDMAVALGRIPRPAPPTTDVVWLRRTDDESMDSEAAARAVRGGMAVDWLAASGREVLPGRVGWSLQALNRRYGREPPDRSDVVARVIRRHLPWTYAALANQRLRFGLSLLSRGRVVVSDRLHGHLLAMLLGIPTVALDNGNGKVRSYVETWFSGDHPALRFATSHDQAASMADELAGAVEDG